MELLLVSKQVARLARKVGFNEPCNYIIDVVSNVVPVEKGQVKNSTYKNITVVPTQAIVAQWLREVHDIHVQPKKIISNDGYKTGEILFKGMVSQRYGKREGTYEQAMNNALYIGLTFLQED